ncbi:MAG: TM helix protein [uncultured bacterium]|nr:MAG: TM helix protein [uncultured bacterium]KKQ45483.1 MAG: Conserved TM helix repeat-containing protein [Candidatus Moranbacteria bacterium GW2011_GWC2_37_8]KKQ62515.1 MAG: Conserved TM helix repeat-containing protein [Parcubacteria group bacterium GW2011_GWC1_38_22]KKQ79399.1 MAG: Conserved TM helix repeat-containing protein [Candidatus Moranbacteria bacterium GW2011_GWD2_38_7]
MNPVQTWGGAIASSLVGLWGRFINFIPTLVGALLVFLLGMIVASVLGKVVERIVRAMRIDGAIERLAISEKLKEHGIEMSVSTLLGKLVQWFLVLVFLMAATDILGLDQVTSFLNSVILYLPNVVVATIVLTIAFLLSSLMYAIVRSSTKAAGVMSATLLATLIKWSIIVFGLLAALIQLGIATSLVNTLFIGLVAALSLAIGLAFGLGGKDEAALILKKIREEITEKK